MCEATRQINGRSEVVDWEEIAAQLNALEDRNKLNCWDYCYSIDPESGKKLIRLFVGYPGSYKDYTLVDTADVFEAASVIARQEGVSLNCAMNTVLWGLLSPEE